MGEAEQKYEKHLRFLKLELVSHLWTQTHAEGLITTLQTYNLLHISDHRKRTLPYVLQLLLQDQDCVKAGAGFNEEQMCSVAPQYLP